MNETYQKKNNWNGSLFLHKKLKEVEKIPQDAEEIPVADKPEPVVE